MKIVCISSLLPTGHYSQILCSSLSQVPGLDLIVYTDQDPENDLVRGCGTIRRVWQKGFGFIGAILAQLDEDRPDVVHLQHEFNMYGGPITALLFPFLILLIRQKGYKTVTTIHGVVATEQITPSFIRQFMLNPPFYMNTFTLKLFFRIIYTYIGNWSNHIVCHTERLKRALINDYHLDPQKTTVMQTIIPSKKILNVPTKSYFFYYGYMVRRKGLEYLLNGFKTFSKTHPEFRLVMAGGVIEGQEGAFAEIKDTIQKLSLSDQIEIKGYIDTEEKLARLYGEAYAVVIPARLSIAASGPLYQAQGYHKCILASDVGNFKEEIQDKKNGLLVRNDHWAESLSLVATDRNLVESLEMGTAARAAEKSGAPMAQKYLQLYTTISK